MLQTALSNWHQGSGARMVDFAGWSMPIQYSSIVEEHDAVRKGCGLFDIAHMGRIWVSGADAVSFLDHVATNHVAQMKPSQVRYSLVCNESGGILDDVLIYNFETEFLVVVNASNREKILSWFEKHKSGFDVSIDDRTQSTFMLAIQGPQAQTILSSLTDVDLSAMKYYSVQRGGVNGVDALVSRTGYTGEDGFEVIVENDAAVDVWAACVAAGEQHGLKPCGLGCRDTLRLEAAMPLYGHEMDEAVDPVTAGLTFGVKLKKSSFLGHEAIREKAEASDSLPKRIGVVLSGRRIAREGATLLVDSEEVGKVTSGTFSPTLQKSIAMGYIDQKYASPGTMVDVDIRGKREPGEIAALPFYKRS
ncbi:Aminomethyltransferase [Thalassoglobus neptunius]|uniref:Aminomethyltransferase n=1 Tax=Thalassoglobus neptunius TaxID=1938619 RepID=A0A5C5WAG9_9PLAN|nr:glycine cleavage system aminomethyltransferase GcvT [Thalassoglobus neptunius]TWT47001.1 Aminomethyltransferase [Thalassoglobus neptunius]